MASAAFLLAARQSRLAARASVCPALAAQHKAAARFWIAQAREARPPPLP